MDKYLFRIESYGQYKDDVLNSFYFYEHEDLKSNFDFFQNNGYPTKLFILNNDEYCEIFSINLSHVYNTVALCIFAEIVENILFVINNNNDTSIADVVESYNKYGNFATDYLTYKRKIAINIKDIYRPILYLDYYDELHGNGYGHMYDYEKYAYEDFGKYIFKKITNGEVNGYGTVTGILKHTIDYEKLGRMMCTDYEGYGWGFIGTHFYRD